MGIGKVYLVGAGPGNPKLITVQGKEAIERADVIVYDRLASPRLLSWAKPEAEMIYVGKLPDRHTLKQQEINQLLVDLALQGKRVTRLKGGDPSIFGRVGEEAETLARAGVPFDIVPGVSSAIAVPMYAGIPVTHREFASSVTIITGHECPNKSDTSLDWARIAAETGTLVFLMGVKNLPAMIEQLGKHGRDLDTPIAVIQWGTSANQRTVVSTLSQIVTDVHAAGLGSPAVIVIGEVVSLRNVLNWYEQKPLFGRRIVVTRARAQASELLDLIDELGGEVWEMPVLEIASTAESSNVPDPAKWDWIIFTSVNAVKAFFEQLRSSRNDVRKWANAKIAVIGQSTAQAVINNGWHVDICPIKQDREGLFDDLKQVIQTGQSVLFPRGQLAHSWLPDHVRALGADVQEWVIYETRPTMDPHAVQAVADAIHAGLIDAVTFTSSSTVKLFVEQIRTVEENFDFNREGAPDYICIGPQTEQTAKSYGIQSITLAAHASVQGIVDQLMLNFTSKMGEKE